MTALWARLRHIQTLQDAAKKDRTWSAVAALETRYSVARDSYDEEYARIVEADRLAAEAAARGRTDADLSPEEWAERIATNAKDAPIADLEVYVKEWLDRIGYDLRTDAGIVSMVRRTRT